MTHQEFIYNIAYYVQMYAPRYGIKVCSPIIAQAILESGWGNSKLASVYHNYFGLTCGTGWTGKSVNMATWEEYTPGTKTNITQNFRVYDSMADGVKGYFEFIQYPRYKNLKCVTDPKRYLELIKADGYATASNYVSAVYNIVTGYHLTEYDKTPAPAPSTETTTPSTERSSFNFTVHEVRQGDTGKSVALMQKCLRGLDYKGANDKLVTVDASAGPNTIYALKSFQKRAGLADDGICADKSWKILLDL